MIDSEKYDRSSENFQECMQEIRFTLKSHPFKVNFSIECRTMMGKSGILNPHKVEKVNDLTERQNTRTLS